MGIITDVAAHIRQIWSSSAFMNVLKINIDEIHCGGATVSMPIDFDLHTNRWVCTAVLWRHWLMLSWALPGPASAR